MHTKHTLTCPQQQRTMQKDIDALQRMIVRDGVLPVRMEYVPEWFAASIETLSNLAPAERTALPGHDTDATNSSFGVAIVVDEQISSIVDVRAAAVHEYLENALVNTLPHASTEGAVVEITNFVGQMKAQGLRETGYWSLAVAAPAFKGLFKHITSALSPKPSSLHVTKGQTDDSGSSAEWFTLEEVNASILLLLSPFNYTGWNRRKSRIQRLLSQGSFGLVDQNGVSDLAAALLSREQAFVDLVQSRHEKPVEAFEHRRWYLRFLLPMIHRSADCITERVHCIGALANEFVSASACIQKRARNYYAWTHKMHCMTLLIDLLPVPSKYRVVLAELKRTQAMARLIPSDHSLLHYRVWLCTSALTRNCPLWAQPLVYRVASNEVDFIDVLEPNSATVNSRNALTRFMSTTDSTSQASMAGHGKATDSLNTSGDVVADEDELQCVERQVSAYCRVP